MGFWAVILLALALSFDGLGVGVAYGLKGMLLPVRARLLVALISVCGITTAFFFGGIIRNWLSVEYSSMIGRVILVLVGLWFLFQAWLEKQEKGVVEGNLPLAEFSLKSLGIVVLVLRHPASADFDRSGTISISEAAFLGLALAMDAIGAGIGALIGAGWPVVTPLVVGLIKFLFLTVGLFIGKMWRQSGPVANGVNPVFNYLPGILLFFLAIIGF